MSEDDNGWQSIDVNDQPHDHVTVLVAVHVVALAHETEDDIIKEALEKVVASCTDPTCPDDIKEDVRMTIADRQYCTEHSNEPDINEISVSDIANVIAFPKKDKPNDSNAG